MAAPLVAAPLVAAPLVAAPLVAGTARCSDNRTLALLPSGRVMIAAAVGLLALDVAAKLFPPFQAASESAGWLMQAKPSLCCGQGAASEVPQASTPSGAAGKTLLVLRAMCRKRGAAG